VDRWAKNKRDRHEQQGYCNNDNRKSSACDDTVGSDLPTLDQFEIAVPSKSFASVSVGDHNNDFPPDSREDDGDNRSTGDISSITSVSYRAGYYYLRNVKNKTPEKPKHSGCLPSCSCASCMPCSCSWLTCCCCSEAKSELVADAAASKPSLITNSQMREKARRAQSPGRRSTLPPGHPVANGPLGYPANYHGSGQRRSGSSDRRYAMAGERSSNMHQLSPIGGECDSIKRNHSLFDELSDEDERTPGYGGQRSRQPQYNQKKNKQKAWLRGRAGSAAAGHGVYGQSQEYGARDRAGRSRSRGRGRRVDQY
jgi:hypothetical protein